MKKSDVYSWRLSPELKSSLEEAARDEGVSLSALLERITSEWLARSRRTDAEEEQRRLHEAASRCFGVLRGGDPSRAENASRRVREVLERRRQEETLSHIR